MSATDFQVKVGSLRAKRADDQSNWYVTALSTDLGIGSIGRASISISAADATLPKLGADVTLELDAKPVFTGHVFNIDAAPETIVITATDDLAKLAKLEVQAAYENKSAGAIAKDILAQVGASAGTIDDGPTFTQYIVHRGPRAMRHLEQLAERAGFFLFTDPKGRIHFSAPKSGNAQHTFEYATHLIHLELRAESPAFDSALVWGEGAAGEKGADRAHWLATKLSSLNGKASVDDAGTVKPGNAAKYPLTVRDGTVRASADASDQAKARMSAIASRILRGFIEIIGDASIEPGHLITIDGIPRDHPLHALASGKVLHVRRVRHTYSARRGFVTRMEF